jgi:hypothetical protein
MFVNPYTCSCVTCVNHVGGAGHGVVETWSPPAAPSLPPPPPIGVMAAAEALVELSRSVLPPIPAHLALGRTITGFGYQPWDAREEEENDGTGTLPADSPRYTGGSVELSAEHASIAAEGLRAHLATLRERQDRVYDGPTRSHDEMAAQDAEFDELDRKISEIEDILATLEE